MSSYAMSDCFRSTASSFDNHRSRFFEDDESSILDENVLESSALDSFDMSPLDGSRRESFVDSAAIFSPKGEWFDRDIAVPDRHATASTNPFEQSNNPFMRMDPAQAASYGQQTSSWSMDVSSGSCTPTAVYDTGFSTDLEIAPATSYLHGSGSSSGPSPYESGGNGHIRPLSVFPPSSSASSSIPPSPHPSKDWMSSVDQVEHSSIPKRMRPGSPSPRANSPLLRREGIRKKNARFEIPAERNLLNIDQLISQSTNDQEIKELKQQKRLLRNRQAALDSRQRKKQHTERLEEEKKQYTSIITDLEDKLAQLEFRENEWLKKEEEWKMTRQQYEQFFQAQELKMEEMVRSHTLETGGLRKKNAFLTEELQKMESPAMPTLPDNCIGNDFTSLDGPYWEPQPMLDEFSMGMGVKDESKALIAPVKKSEGKLPAFSENIKPASEPGFLLILLLCGAFVASQTSTHSSPIIPRMPDNIRAASATVLDTLFKDAGVQQADQRGATVGRVEVLEPRPSGSAWPVAKVVPDDSEMIGLSSSSLNVLNHQLVQPSKEQEQEQLFSLSAAQYNGVTSQDFGREPESSTSRGRRNLEEGLAAMRNNKQTAAEVYTRSLMWDKLPADVVRDFAKLVAASNPRQQDAMGYENEEVMG